MNPSVPCVRYPSPMSARALGFLAVLLGLLADAVCAQPVDFDIYYPTTAAELITAIEQANMNPDRFAVINLDGTYVFEELYVEPGARLTTSHDGIGSVTPTITVGASINISESTTLDASSTSGPTGDKTTAFRKEKDFSVVAKGFVIFAVLFGGIDDNFPESPERAPPGEALLMQGESTASPIFKGFDYIVRAIDSNVVTNGISAGCREQCVWGENSRIIVANSRFESGHAGVWAEGSDLTTETIDFGPLRRGLEASDIDATSKAIFLRRVDQSEQLFADYDVAVVDSETRSRSVAVFQSWGSSDNPPARVLVSGSLLSTTSSSDQVLFIRNGGSENYLRDTVLSSPNSILQALDMNFGELTASNLFIDRGHEGLGLTQGTMNLSSSAVSVQGRDPGISKPACKLSFTGDRVVSSGYNIVSDDTCGLDGTGDLESTDPGLFLPDDGSLIPEFTMDSPAIDGGPMDVADGSLPCSTTDITGLPRPQDGNGDGIAECDVGPVEFQAGEAIGAPQTGAFYNILRSGEGVFVEMLGNGKAVVYIFSYTPDGMRAFWAVGLGDVVGNGIVIRKHSFKTTRGGIFGDGFDPATVERIPFADIAISFPDCENGDNAGVLAIEANADMGFGPLLSRTTRLTSVLTCGSVAKGPGYTGSFADKTHSGEGIIVQVVSATRAVVMWFTFDKDGNQLWITGTGTIDGNTITVTDAYTQTGPSYGPGYDKTDRVRTAWGDFSVVFEPDCNKAVLNYASIIAAFGSGTQNVRRLTNIDGVACGL